MSARSEQSRACACTDSHSGNTHSSDWYRAIKCQEAGFLLRTSIGTPHAKAVVGDGACLQVAISRRRTCAQICITEKIYVFAALLRVKCMCSTKKQADHAEQDACWHAPVAAASCHRWKMRVFIFHVLAEHTQMQPRPVVVVRLNGAHGTPCGMDALHVSDAEGLCVCACSPMCMNLTWSYVA